MLKFIDQLIRRAIEGMTNLMRAIVTDINPENLPRRRPVQRCARAIRSAESSLLPDASVSSQRRFRLAINVRERRL